MRRFSFPSPRKFFLWKHLISTIWQSCTQASAAVKTKHVQTSLVKYLNMMWNLWRSTDFGAVIRVRMFQSLVSTPVNSWDRGTVFTHCTCTVMISADRLFQEVQWYMLCNTNYVFVV